MIRVAVAGALGRMGRVAIKATTESAGMEYVGGFARARVPEERLYNDLQELFDSARPDVLVDMTIHPASVEIAMEAVAHGVRPVVGVSGWEQSERDVLDRMARERGIGAMIVPNFSIGAVLMMRFAQDAARFFPSVEIVEMHHDQKKDAPSGTARITAERIAAHSTHAEVPIHSVRLRGLLAHQEVLFGNTGEVLTIRHDSLARDSFAPGIAAAISGVMTTTGLVVGLDRMLDEVQQF